MGLRKSSTKSSVQPTLTLIFGDLNVESHQPEVYYPKRIQGWPSGLGSELIIRLRQVQLLHPGLLANM